MDKLRIFKKEEFGEVRALSIKGEPWFVGKDIVTALGYDLSTGNSYTKYIKRYCYEEDVKNYNKETQVHYGLELDYRELGQRGGLLINESALYDLTLESPIPGAREFKKWVTHEVLPQIRKTGGYIPFDKEDDDATIMAKALMIAQKTIEAKTKELENVNRVVNQFSISKNTKLVRETAKAISKAHSEVLIGERRLYNKMRDWGWVCKNSTEPTQYAVEMGYLEVSEGTKETVKGTFTFRTTRVTGKGEIRIVEKLLKEVK